MRILSGRITNIVLLILLFVLLSVSVSFAQTEDSSLSATPTPIEYQLPFPGLLPDHPMYFLRQLRDDVFGFFISGSLRRGEYDLLQADKRVEASWMLVKKNKVDLAEKTLTQAISYFEKAIDKTIEAKKQGMESTDLAKRLSLANLKHQEVVKELEKKNQKKFTDERKHVKELEKRVKALQPKK